MYSQGSNQASENSREPPDIHFVAQAIQLKDLLKQYEDPRQDTTH